MAIKINPNDYPTAWTSEEGSRRLEQFQKLNPYIYMQRHNIHEETRNEDPTDENSPTYTVWVAESRKITKEQYDLLINDLYTPAHTELIANQTDSMEGLADIYASQSALSASQTDVEEAIADLYEVITELKE